jgi:hypothetical protein
MGGMVLIHFCDSLLLFNHRHSSRVHNSWWQPHYEINPINPAGTNLSQCISGTLGKGSEKYGEEQPSREREHLAERPPHKGVQRSIPSSALPCSLVPTRPSCRAYVRCIHKKKQQHQPSLVPFVRQYADRGMQSTCIVLPSQNAESASWFIDVSRQLHCVCRLGSSSLYVISKTRVAAHCSTCAGPGFRSSIPRVSSHGWTLRCEKFYCISMRHFQASRLCRYARRHNSGVRPLGSQPASPSSRSPLSQLGSRTRKRGS